MARASTPRVANPEVHVLAEGPFWDPGSGLVLWVDIQRGLVFAGELADDDTIAIVERVTADTTVGAVAAAEDGGWLIAGARGLLTRAPGEEPRPWLELLTGGGRRLNDGKPAPDGRYVVGSLSLSGPSTTEQLWAVGLDGAVQTLDDDLTLSNGLAWTADGGRMYSVDTLRRRIHVRSPGGRREVFVELEDGFPDGVCLDAEEHLWVAVWGRGEVRRYSPTGALADTIRIPAPHVSAVVFAGAGLDVLVVTTASDELSAEQLAAFPDSGRLFTLHPGVTGLPQPLWRGSTRSKDS